MRNNTRVRFGHATFTLQPHTLVTFLFTQTISNQLIFERCLRFANKERIQGCTKNQIFVFQLRYSDFCALLKSQQFSSNFPFAKRSCSRYFGNKADILSLPIASLAAAPLTIQNSTRSTIFLCNPLKHISQLGLTLLLVSRRCERSF